MSESDQYRCSLCGKLQSRECEHQVLTHQKKDGITSEVILLVCPTCDSLVTALFNGQIEALDRLMKLTELKIKWSE